MQEWMLLLTMMTEANHRRPMGPPPPAQVVAMTAPAQAKVRALSLPERVELQQAVIAMSSRRAPELHYDLATKFYLPAAGEAAPELSAESRMPASPIR